MSEQITIWGLTSGSAGMASQVRGVGELLAEKTAGTFTLKSVRRIKPFCWFPGNWNFAALQQLTKDSDSLSAPYPDILISSGRRSVALALAIKRASGGKTKLVNLQGPRIPLHHFDLVVPMQHDGLQGENVFETLTALHHLTDAKLAKAASAYAYTLTDMPAPRVAFMLGGSTHAYTLDSKRLQTLAAQLESFIQQHQGSVWISTSRRTGAKNIKALQIALAMHNRVSIYTGDGANPYIAWLALADVIVVTNDSVSMMSEALFTGKPVIILPLPEHQNTKPANFADGLIKRGFAKPFTLPIETYMAQRIDEKEMVVMEIIKRFSLTSSQ